MICFFVATENGYKYNEYFLQYTHADQNQRGRIVRVRKVAEAPVIIINCKKQAVFCDSHIYTLIRGLSASFVLRFSC